MYEMSEKTDDAHDKRSAGLLMKRASIMPCLSCWEVEGLLRLFDGGEEVDL